MASFVFKHLNLHLMLISDRPHNLKLISGLLSHVVSTGGGKVLYIQRHSPGFITR